MITTPSVPPVAHIVADLDDLADGFVAPAAVRPRRYAGRWSSAREVQRASARRRFLAGWAALDPALAPALRRVRR